MASGGNPLPPGGDMDAGGDDESDDAKDKGEFGDRLRDRWHGDSSDFPENPLQEFEGSGMATAASASGSLRGSGQVDGSWDMHGILHDDKWDSLVGSALDAFTEATSSEGSSNGMIVLRDAGTSDDGTSEWGWAIDYISDGNASDEAGLGGSVSTELSPTDDGLK